MTEGRSGESHKTDINHARQCLLTLMVVHLNIPSPLLPVAAFVHGFTRMRSDLSAWSLERQ